LIRRERCSIIGGERGCSKAQRSTVYPHQHRELSILRRRGPHVAVKLVSRTQIL
jgi:hypothetical protein